MLQIDKGSVSIFVLVLEARNIVRQSGERGGSKGIRRNNSPKEPHENEKTAWFSDIGVMWPMLDDVGFL